MLVLGMTACSKPYTWDGSLEALLESQPEHFRVVLEDCPSDHLPVRAVVEMARDAAPALVPG